LENSGTEGNEVFKMNLCWDHEKPAGKERIWVEKQLAWNRKGLS